MVPVRFEKLIHQIKELWSGPAGRTTRTPPHKACSMLDLIYLVLGFAFFALMALYLRFVAHA